MKTASGIICFVSLLLGTVFFQCSRTTVVGGPGTGSETTNGITAKAEYPSGQPASFASVFLKPKNFLPDTAGSDTSSIPDATTDSAGTFVIDSVDTGEYTVEINDKKANAVIFTVKKDSVSKKPVDFGKQVLQPTSTLSGHIDRSNFPLSVSVYVQIYGMNKTTTVDKNGAFSFSDIPGGIRELRIIASDKSLGTIDHDSIVVSPGFNHDLGNFQLPVNFWQDTLIVRAILDSNGLANVPVSKVSSLRDGRIFQLDLSHRGLKRLPQQIGQLRITHLYLDSNSLESLPSEIGSIASLVTLHASANRLGTIPAAIGNLKGLQHLDLSNNLIDSLPVSVSGLVSLVDLWLQNNALTVLPESLGNLGQLRMLNLETNKIASLPLSITRLHSLAFLSVLHNRLATVPPSVASWLDMYSTEKEWRVSQLQ